MPLLPDEDVGLRDTQLGGVTSLMPQADDTVIRLRAAMGVAAPKNADKSAEVFRLQTRTGLPSDLIERNFDEVKAEAERSGFDPEEFTARSPLVSKWLAENPDHVTLAKDDLDNLSNLESLTRALTYGFQQGSRQTRLGRLGYQEMGSTNPKLREQISVLERQVEREPAGTGFMRQYVYRASKIVGQLYESASRGAETGLATGAAGALVGGAAGLATGPAAPGAVPITATAGFVTGATAGTAVGFIEDIFKIESGLAYLELNKIRTPEGQGIDPLVQKGAAVFVGLSNAALETLGVRMITAPFVAAGRKLMADAARSALARPTTMKALGEFGKAWGTAVGGETATEIMQEGVNIFAEEVAKTITDPRFATLVNDPNERDVAIERLAAIAEETFKGMALLGVPGAVTSGAVSMRRAKDAETREKMYKALGSGVKASKLMERMPEKAQEAIRAMTADGPVTEVYVPVEQFVQYWQSKNIDPRDVAREAMGDTKAFDEAVSTGADIQIPIDVYASKIAPTEHNEFFAQEIRRRPDEMNAREAREFKERSKQEQEQEKVVEGDAERARISESVARQLEAAGFEKTAAASMAEQMSAVFATQSQRLGDVSPTALFERYGLRVARQEQMPQTADQVFNQIRRVTQTQEFAQAFGQSVAVDSDGQPRLYYHGSARDIHEWRPKQADAIYVTPDVDVAEDFTKYAMDYSDRVGVRDAAPVIYPMFVRAERPFDFEDAAHIDKFVAWLSEFDEAEVNERVVSEGASKNLIGQYVSRDHLVEGLRQGAWGAVEHPLVQEYIRGATSHDGFFVMEAGAKNLAVFEPDQLINALTGQQFQRDDNLLFQPAFHGSPHIFDKFDLQKIGTGEGAQAYGWGLYFTSLKAIAKWYRDNLTQHQWTAEAQELQPKLGEVAQQYLDDFGLAVERDGDVQAAAEAQLAFAEEHNAVLEEGMDRLSAKDLRILRKIFKGINKYWGKSKGRLYQVEIPDAESMLDWNKRMSEQPVQVQERLRAAGLLDIPDNERSKLAREYEVLMDKIGQATGILNINVIKGAVEGVAEHQKSFRDLQRGGVEEQAREAVVLWDEMHSPELIDQPIARDQTGQSFYHELAERLDVSEELNKWNAATSREAASRYLNSIGIYGLTYVGKTSGERDFVIFDDSLVQITGYEQGAIRRNPFKESVVQQRVYHGTGSVIRRFSKDRIGSIVEDASVGFYFTANPEQASEYADSAADALVGGNQGANVVPVYLDIKNPYVLEAPEGEPAETVIDGFLNTLGDNEFGLDVRDLQEQGYDGVIAHPGEGMHGERGVGTIYVVFENKQIKSAIDLKTMQEGKIPEAGPRGFMQILKDKKFEIVVLKDADLSTFLHESGHFYLEVMRDLVKDLRARDPAALNDLQRKMLEDADTLAKWMGIESLDKVEVKHHEMFARANEAYLMEGKAPSGALRAAFMRFRAWLVALYRTIANLNVRMNDDVREVFDRLYATDAEIEAVRNEGLMEPMFLTPEKAGMTPDEFTAYRKTVEDAGREAQEELQNRLIAEYQREQKAWWREAKAEVREDVFREFANRREYVAMAVLRAGELPDGSPLPKGMDKVKLDKAALIEIYGEFDSSPVMQKLNRLGLYRTEGGLHPDVVAEALGFKSGDEMVKMLIDLEPLVSVVNRETDARMLAKYGSMLLDGSLVDRARQAVMNDKQSKILHAELRALWAQARAARPVVSQAQTGLRRARAEGLDVVRSSVAPLGLVRQIAQEQVARSRMRDIQPHKFYVAARRFAARAVDEAAKGNYEEAANAKQRQLLNLELYREATNARDEGDEAVAFMRGLNSSKVRARLGKAGQSYVDQIDGLLDRFDFARITLRDSSKRVSLAKWIKEREEEGMSIDLPEDIVNEAFRKSWREMTFEEIRGVRDAAKHVMHVAKLKNKLMTVQDQRAFEEVRDDILASVVANARHERKSARETRLPQNEIVRGISGFFASHRKVASLVREMDGFKDGGPLWNYLVREMNKAGTREAAMHAEASKKLKAIFKVYSTKDLVEMYRKSFVPEINDSLSHMARIMVALNWGNEDNRQKLMDGYGWSPSQVQAILDGLPERNWKVVQGILDYVNEFWPEIESKQRRVTGLAPEKVQASSIQTKFGEFKGGYFPLKYDERQSPKVFGDRVKEAARLTELGGYTRATTRRGHTVTRVEGVKLPIRLDFGVILEHSHQVIHDLTHHEFLIDANRLMSDKQFSRAVIDHYGDITYDQFRSALQDIAAGNIPAVGFLEKGMNWMRHGVSIAAMGWNLMTGFMQILGMSQSIARVGPVWFAKGLGHWFGDAARMENSIKWVHATSKFMQTRHDTMMREINEIRNSVRVKGKLAPLTDTYFWLITRMQMITDIPTWLGAYEKAHAEGMDEAKAVDFADSTVLETQGGGQIKDLSRVQRGGPLLKLWTNFYSYFNVTFNMTAEGFRRTMRNPSPVEIGRFGADLLFLYVMPSVMATLLKEGLRGDMDDDDELLKKIAREQIAYILGTVLLARELSGAAMGFYGYEGPAGSRLFAEAGNLVQQIEQGEVDAAMLKALNNSAGILFHYPAGQVQRSVEGFIAMSEGRTSNPLALLVGPRKE